MNQLIPDLAQTAVRRQGHLQATWQVDIVASKSTVGVQVVVKLETSTVFKLWIIFISFTHI